MALQSAQDCVADGREIVGNRWKPFAVAAPILDQSGQHEGVELHDVAGFQRGDSWWDQLVAGGNDGNLGPSSDRNLGDSRRSTGPQVHGGELVILRQHQFGGHQVLAQCSNVLPGSHRSHDLHGLFVDTVNVLDHDHGVVSRWHGVAGVHPDNLRAHRQVNRRSLGGSVGVRRPNSDSVHGGGVVMGRGPGGPDRAGGDSPQGLVQGDRLPRHGRQGVGLLQRVVKPPARFIQGYIAQEVPAAVLGACRRFTVVGPGRVQYNLTETSSPA